MTYEIDWDKHLDDVTEETMLERTPALALDFLYHLVSLNQFYSQSSSK